MYRPLDLYLKFYTNYRLITEFAKVRTTKLYQFVARRDALSTEKFLQYGHWRLQGHVIYLLYIHKYDQGGNEMENIIYLMGGQTDGFHRIFDGYFFRRDVNLWLLTVAFVAVSFLLRNVL